MKNRKIPTCPTIEENRQLVTDGLVEFEKKMVEVQDCRKFTDHFRGIYRIYPNLIKENRRMSTCHRLDLQTLRISTDYARNLPDHSVRLGNTEILTDYVQKSSWTLRRTQNV
jgi:hypothetical protein